MKTTIIFIIFSLFLFVSFSEISFGSYQQEKIIDFKNETLLIYKILIWNSGKNDIKVSFEIVEKPKNLEVYIDKRELILTQNIENDFEILIINNREIKAIPINVYFYALKKDISGYVKIKAIAESLEKANIPIKQERSFIFFIKDSSNETEKKEIQTNLIEKFVESFSYSFEKIRLNILPMLIVFFSLIISLLIILLSRKRKS